MEDKEKTKFKYSPEAPQRINNPLEISKNRNEEITNWFDQADNIFESVGIENDQERPARISGNSNTLLQPMAEEGIGKELFYEEKKGIIEDFEPKDAGQDTIGRIVENLGWIEYKNNENTFNYNLKLKEKNCIKENKSEESDSSNNEDYEQLFSNSPKHNKIVTKSLNSIN